MNVQAQHMHTIMNVNLGKFHVERCTATSAAARGIVLVVNKQRTIIMTLEIF
jgi:hypothetical protein